jgi:hypothetical protein
MGQSQIARLWNNGRASLPASMARRSLTDSRLNFAACLRSDQELGPHSCLRWSQKSFKDAGTNLTTKHHTHQTVTIFKIFNEYFCFCSGADRSDNRPPRPVTERLSPSFIVSRHYPLRTSLLGQREADSNVHVRSGKALIEVFR